jgi:hypothetical protein
MIFGDILKKPQVDNPNLVSIAKKIDPTDSICYIYLNNILLQNMKDIGSYIVIINTSKSKSLKSHPTGVFVLSKSNSIISGNINCLSYSKSQEFNIEIEWKPFEYPKLVIKNINLPKQCEITFDIQVV